MQRLLWNLTSVVNHTVMRDRFCTQHMEGPLVWAVLCGCCTVAGIPVSLWLLWLLIQKRHEGSTNDIYMLSLTTMDFIFNISLPMYILNFQILFLSSVTKLTDFLGSFNALGRPLFMACMCVDCYLAVGYPVFYMKLRGKPYRLILCVLVWVSTFVYGAVMVLQPQVLSLGFVAAPNILTLPVILGCDVAIIRTLKRPDVAGRADVHPQKKRALQIITYSLVVVLLCCLPPIVVFLATPLIHLQLDVMFCQVFIPVSIPPSLSSVIMPLLQLIALGSLNKFHCAKQL